MYNTCEHLQLLSIRESTRQEVADTRIRKMSKKIRKRKQHSKSYTCYVQRDIIPNILCRIPAEQLHGKLRFVCRLWCDIISTELDPALPDTECKFILQNPYSSKAYSRVMALRNEEFVSHHDQFTCEMGEIINSCKGLLLWKDSGKQGVLHVSNKVLGKDITIPACPSGCLHKACSCCLAFDSSANVFKIVHLYADQFGYEIFSLGVDHEWRKLPGPFSETYMRSIDVEWENPVTVQGKILHWNFDSNEYLISMDVSEEKSKRTYLPITADTAACKFRLLEMGGLLSLMFFVTNTQIDIWNLEDFGTGSWLKRHSIASSLIISNMRINPSFQNLEPLLTLRNGEVILFQKDELKNNSSLYTYDVKACKLKKLKTSLRSTMSLLVHVSSFMSWDPRDKLPTASQLYESLLSPTRSSIDALRSIW